jgi:hypothetical protein
MNKSVKPLSVEDGTASELKPLIEQVKAVNTSHIVVFISDAGIHWRGESEAACEVMANIIGNCKVMPREKFIEELETIYEH